MQILPSGATNTIIVLPAGMNYFASFESVYLYTNVYTLKGTVRNIFLYKKATTKRNEIQSWHFWQSEQDSILSHFYPIMTCHQLFFQDWQQKWSPSKKWLEYVKSLFRHSIHPWGIWNLWFLVIDVLKVANSPLQCVDSANSTMAKKYWVF